MSGVCKCDDCPYNDYTTNACLFRLYIKYHYPEKNCDLCFHDLVEFCKAHNLYYVPLNNDMVVEAKHYFFERGEFYG